MWSIIKWTFWGLFWLILAAFLHYTLPQHDVARITHVDTRRVDFGENWFFYSHAGAGDQEGVQNRDVFFISAKLTDGKPMEYRNEDTGWNWPPYFKFDSSSLNTEATDLISTEENPKWVVIRHYGWRSNLFSIFPNAVAIWRVEGPDVRIIPWFNILFLTVFAALAWAIWVRLRRFREQRIDPVLEDWSESFDAAGDAVQDTRSRLRRWLDSWRET